MVGQRLRVWPARLTRWLTRRSVLLGSVALVLLATCGTLVLRRLANDWLGDSTTDALIRPGTRPADAQSNNSPNNPPNNSPNNSPSNSAGSPALADPDSTHPLDSVLRIAKVSMETHKRNHRDFRAMVRKRERIGKELGPESRMEIKLRYRDEDPQTGQRRMDVYLKFIEPKSQAGREVIWQEGLNDGLMVVHEAGFLNITRLELSPTSKLAMLGNRYPISDIGIERLLAKLLFKGNRDQGWAIAWLALPTRSKSQGGTARGSRCATPSLKRSLVTGRSRMNFTKRSSISIPSMVYRFATPVTYGLKSPAANRFWMKSSSTSN